MPVKMMRRMTAAAAPKIMPHSRCLGASPRHASAITSALSPDSRTLIQMILPTATQNAGWVISLWNWVTNAPMFAGSKICHNQFTALPFGLSTALGGDFVILTRFLTRTGIHFARKRYGRRSS